MVWFLASRDASPRATSIIASVTINGGMAKKVIIHPEKAPHSAQAATPARQQRIMAMAAADSPPARSRISQAETTADKATRLPTDKSMPPVMMTKVMPTAIIAITAIWLAMFSKLLV